MTGESPVPRWYHEDNGFPVLDDLHEAHGGVAHAVRPLIARRAVRIIDVGCGNGALLERLCREHPQVIPFGVDRDAAKIAAAHALHPACRAHFVAGCAFDVTGWWRADWTFEWMILCPGRFLERPSRDTAALRRAIAERVDQVLLYAYSDWLSVFGDLESIARRAGFGAVTPLVLPSLYRRAVVQCALVRPG